MTWTRYTFSLSTRSVSWSFIFFAVSYLAFDIFIHPTNAFHTHHLVDPDDYMRLNEVVNWLTGQSWYDLSHPRLSPGHHTIVHWSRLVDVPLYFVILLLNLFLPFNQAVLDASFVVPPVTFLVMIGALGLMGRFYLTKKLAYFPLLFLPLVPNLLFHFTPGKVDHHGYQLIVAAFTLAVIPDILFLAHPSKRTYLAGVVMAAGLWIGTEILPLLVCVLIILTTFCSLRGQNALRNYTVYTGSLLISASFFLMIARPPSEWSDRSISWFSLAAVLFSLFTFLAALGARSACTFIGKPSYRLLISFLMAALAGLCFIIAVPHLKAGAFANYDDFNATIALRNITEAIPLSRLFAVSPNNAFSLITLIAGFLNYLMLPSLALAFALYQSCHRRGRSRILWVSSSFLILSFLCFALFYQQRLLWYLSVITLPVLAAGFRSVYQAYQQCTSVRQKLRILTGVFLVLFPFGSYTVSSLYIYLTKDPSLTSSQACQLEPILSSLLTQLGPSPITLMAPFDEGPELLLTTPYQVIGANFNVYGNKDVYRFFRAQDEAEALGIIKEWNVGAVLVCRQFPAFFAGQEHIKFGDNAYLKKGDDGRLHIVSSLTSPTMIEDLATGHSPPWLIPVELQSKSDYLLYRVDPKILREAQ